MFAAAGIFSPYSSMRPLEAMSEAFGTEVKGVHRVSASNGAVDRRPTFFAERQASFFFWPWCTAFGAVGGESGVESAVCY